MATVVTTPEVGDFGGSGDRTLESRASGGFRTDFWAVLGIWARTGGVSGESGAEWCSGLGAGDRLGAVDRA